MRFLIFLSSPFVSCRFLPGHVDSKNHTSVSQFQTSWTNLGSLRTEGLTCDCVFLYQKKTKKNQQPKDTWSTKGQLPLSHHYFNMTSLVFCLTSYQPTNSLTFSVFIIHRQKNTDIILCNNILKKSSHFFTIFLKKMQCITSYWKPLLALLAVVQSPSAKISNSSQNYKLGKQ